MQPSVYLLTPTSAQAKRWMKLNLHCERWQRVGESVGIEACQLETVLDGMTAAGLERNVDYVVVS